MVVVAEEEASIEGVDEVEEASTEEVDEEDLTEAVDEVEASIEVAEEAEGALIEAEGVGEVIGLHRIDWGLLYSVIKFKGLNFISLDFIILCKIFFMLPIFKS